MISTGKRNPRYDGASTPTRPAPPTSCEQTRAILPATRQTTKLTMPHGSRRGSFRGTVYTHSSQPGVGPVHGEPDFSSLFSAQIDLIRAPGGGGDFPPVRPVDRYRHCVACRSIPIPAGRKDAKPIGLAKVYRQRRVGAAG